MELKAQADGNRSGLSLFAFGHDWGYDCPPITGWSPPKPPFRLMTPATRLRSRRMLCAAIAYRRLSGPYTARKYLPSPSRSGGQNDRCLGLGGFVARPRIAAEPVVHLVSGIDGAFRDRRRNNRTTHHWRGHRPSRTWHR